MVRKIWWAVLVAVLLLWGTTWALEERGPIEILSDADFTPENGVVGGSGTPDDPFVIAGWKIDLADAPFAIYIRGVTLPFVIRDVEICGAGKAAIKIETSRNGRVQDVVLRGSPAGLVIALSRDIWVEGVRISACSDAIRALFSQRLHFQGVAISDCTVGFWFSGVTGSEVRGSSVAADLGVLLELGSTGNLFAGNAFSCRIPVRSEGGNRWDDGTRGNYWEGFSAPDADGDGILDVPYRVSPGEEDRFPLAVKPAAE